MVQNLGRDFLLLGMMVAVTLPMAAHSGHSEPISTRSNFESHSNPDKTAKDMRRCIVEIIARR